MTKLQTHKPVLALTMGDPAGVGPEVLVKSLRDAFDVCTPLIYGDPHVLERAAAICGVAVDLVQVQPGDFLQSEETAYVVPINLPEGKVVVPGKPDDADAIAAHTAIVQAAQACIGGFAEGMVTAPIGKEVMKRAGFPFPGHTELLAHLTGVESHVMMLAGSRLRVALVTIHEALSAVPSLLSTRKIAATIRTVHHDLKRYFVDAPRIAVLALNPHCGEGGLFGSEEATIISPAVEAVREEGIDASGPYSADTLFHFAVQGRYDAVIAMYHDQGLIPLKLLHFDDGVNITLGLPIIRTSVDHGTAYDIAGTGKASAGSMIAAIRTAAAMALRKREGA